MDSQVLAGHRGAASVNVAANGWPRHRSGVPGRYPVRTHAALANTWGTPEVVTKPCDTKDPGRHWAVFNHQISLALA